MGFAVFGRGFAIKWPRLEIERRDWSVPGLSRPAGSSPEAKAGGIMYTLLGNASPPTSGPRRPHRHVAGRQGWYTSGN